MSQPFTMESVAVPGRISGQEIVLDLLDRLAEHLAKNCDLRPSDSYAGYSATCTVHMQCHDVDTTEAVADLVIGQLNAQKPIAGIAMSVTSITPEQVQERLGLPQVESLERTVDGSEPQPDGPAPQPGKRYYAPRWATPGSRAARGPDDVSRPDDIK